MYLICLFHRNDIKIYKRIKILALITTRYLSNGYLHQNISKYFNNYLKGRKKTCRLMLQHGQNMRKSYFRIKGLVYFKKMPYKIIEIEDKNKNTANETNIKSLFTM